MMIQKMNRYLRTILLLSFLLIASSGFSQKDNVRQEKWATAVSLPPMENFYKVDDGVYRSGQPVDEAFVVLEKFGIHEILSLRYWHDNEKKAKETDIVLHQVPMNAYYIRDKDVVAALKVIRNRKGKLLFHCQHGSDRTGLICAMYRIVFQKWSKADAINEMKNGGYGFHRIFFNIPRYIENVDVNKIKQAVEN